MVGVGAAPSPRSAEITCKLTSNFAARRGSYTYNRMRQFTRNATLSCLLQGNGDCNGSADHRVVAHADKTHHLHMGGN